MSNEHVKRNNKSTKTHKKNHKQPHKLMLYHKQDSFHRYKVSHPFPNPACIIIIINVWRVYFVMLTLMDTGKRLKVVEKDD